MSAPAHDLSALIKALSRPEAYPHPTGPIEVHQTHISVVFLAGPFAYKIKKPVDLGFLDFSTLGRRKHFCEEEVRLNRRLAPQVYLDVVPIIRDGSTSMLRVGVSAQAQDVVEWAVQMKRLPAEETLENQLERGKTTVAQIRVLAERVAAFHGRAESNEHISSFGLFTVVAKNARENFKQAEPLVGTTVSPLVFERVRGLTEDHLNMFHDLIEARARRGVPRGTHGDLHLDHVYSFPAEAAPKDLVIIDCIEFADRFRFADPLADAAFLAMDLAFHGRRDLASAFADAYFTASGDQEGRALLPFYSAYRAVVRAKVEGMELGEMEVALQERLRAEQRARAHWLLALGELEAPEKRPALVLIAGLPGSGKSTLARSLAASGHFTALRSDVIRKELADAARTDSANFEEGVYADAWSERTYDELRRRAEEILWQGGRVIIDANMRDDRRRQPFFEVARNLGVPVVFIHCVASDAATRQRLNARRNDASDADWRIFEQLRQTWQPVGAAWARLAYQVDTSGPLEENKRRIQAILRQEGLFAS